MFLKKMIVYFNRIIFIQGWIKFLVALGGSSFDIDDDSFRMCKEYLLNTFENMKDGKILPNCIFL